MERWLIIADTHLDSTKATHYSYNLLKEAIRDIRPHGIVHLGDLLEFEYIATFNREKLKFLEGKRFKADYEFANKELDYWQKWCNLFVLRQGNHDARVDRLLERKPMFEGLIEFEENLMLEARGIRYAKEEEPPTKIGHCHFIHGWYWNQYHARKHLDAMKGNIVYGHVHEHQEHSAKLPSHGEEIGAWSIPCLTDLNPQWMRGRMTRFMNGFALMDMDEKTGAFALNVVRIIDGQFIWDGHIWRVE